MPVQAPSAVVDGVVLQGAHLGALTSRASEAGSELYERALVHARAREFEAGSQAFEELLSVHPHHTKAWISYAQMSKKSAGRIGKSAGAEASRSVLQRGISHNPTSGQLHQAAGLLELESGRSQEALALLHRAVELQPSLAPVLKWKPVQEAQALAQQQQQQEQQQA